MDMMELDGIGQADALFGISGLKEDLMDVAVLGASAGVAMVAGEYLFSKVEFLQKQGVYAKSGIAVALGAAGGIAAARYVNKSVGAGVAAGLIGWGVATAAAAAMAKSAPTAGIGQYNSDLLLGLHATPGVVDNDIAISDYRPLPGQTNGLAQAGDVYTSDLQPLPGTSGTSGYMSGVGSFLA